MTMVTESRGGKDKIPFLWAYVVEPSLCELFFVRFNILSPVVGFAFEFELGSSSVKPQFRGKCSSPLDKNDVFVSKHSSPFPIYQYF
jgi:hypothetical protein